MARSRATIVALVMLLSALMLTAALDLASSIERTATLAPAAPTAAARRASDGKPRWAVKSRTRAVASAPRSEKPVDAPTERARASLQPTGLQAPDPIGLRLPLGARCTRLPRDPPIVLTV